jgi:hypothetical protein
MTEIRPFARDDLGAVSDLLQRHLPGWAHDRGFLSRTLVDSPWADPDLPSLVAIDEQGDILGFIGAQVRRLQFDDRELRGVCCGHLTVAADRGAGHLGALLLRRVLSGPQDLTWTDSPTEGVVRMWRAFGGHVDHPRSCDWMLVLRPLRWTGGVLTTIARRASIRESMPVAAIPVQAGGRLVPRAFRPRPPAVGGEDASASEIVDELPALTRGLRLRVAYEQPYLERLLAEVESVLGSLVRRVVRREGRPIGWYCYLSRPGGASRVLHLCAPEPELDAVVSDLTHDARRRGSAALTGRLEPHLEGPLRRRLAVIGFARQPLIHVRDPELHALLSTGSALLTRLDGEWYVT